MANATPANSTAANTGGHGMQDNVRLHTQVMLLARQVQRSPLPVLLVLLVGLYAIWPQIHLLEAVAWLGGVFFCLAARFIYARRVTQANQAANATTVLRNLVLFAFANGLAVGIGPLYIFDSLGSEKRAIITMLLVGLSAGGISTSGAFPQVFLAYILPALLPVAGAWAWIADRLQPMQEKQPFISFTIILFIVILYIFVRENHKVFKDSVQIRFEREHLLSEVQQKNAELQLAMQQTREARDRAEIAGQAKARVLAAASHDLRQPLHALSLYSAVLSQHPDQATLEEVAKQINLSVRALSALLNALLDISRLDAGVVQIEARTFDVKAELQRIVAEFQPLAQRKGLTLYTDLQALRTYTDPVVFQQITRNLLENAIKYTEQGVVLVSARREGEQVRVAVQDTGRGIPEHELSRIFEEFYQLDNPGRNRDQGLRLGLSIVKRLAELVRSRITVTSTLHQGSCFSWLVPLDRRGQQEHLLDALPADSPRVLNPKWHILVIEDEAPIRHGMNLLLHSWGIQAHDCATLTDAERIMDTQTVHMVIADLRLQDGADGLQVAQQLRLRRPGLAVLLISGETDPAKLRSVADSGLPLMSKPIEPETLREHIDRKSVV